MKYLILALSLFAVSVFGQEEITNSIAYGLWSPTRPGDCTKEQHDSYFHVIDGKRYPTWHPPVEKNLFIFVECTYGHEHGLDPSKSDLYDPENPPVMGYVNEQMALVGATHEHRHEDHVGHKYYYINDYIFKSRIRTVGTLTPLDLPCDVMGKLHQGTHSKDAFTNSMHEQLLQIGCEDGTKVKVQIMSNIGVPGNIRQACKAATNYYVGPPTPLNTPTGYNPHNINRSPGDRVVPTNLCFDGLARPQASTALFELWRTANDVNGIGEIHAFGWSFYFGVTRPSRFFDIKTNALARTIDTCWPKTELGTYLVVSNPCVDLRKLAQFDPAAIAWDDTRSPFKGDGHSVRMTGWIKRTLPANHPTVWYTNILGTKASATPFPGSVQQEMSGPPVPEFVGGVHAVTGINFAVDSTASHPTVRAPN
jgi:hypothetical protein